jgi:hypothetical protein
MKGIKEMADWNAVWNNPPNNTGGIREFPWDPNILTKTGDWVLVTILRLASKETIFINS